MEKKSADYCPRHNRCQSDFRPGPSAGQRRERRDVWRAIKLLRGWRSAQTWRWEAVITQGRKVKILTAQVVHETDVKESALTAP